MNHEDTVEGSVQGLAVPNQINDHLDLLVDYDCLETQEIVGSEIEMMHYVICVATLSILDHWLYYHR